MTYTFKDFESQYWSDDNDFHGYEFVENLTSEQIADLKNELRNAQDAEFEDVMVILHDHAGVKNVPVSVIKEILEDNLLLAMEVFSGGVGDSCQREILIDSFLKKFGVGSWPTYGASEEYKKVFYEKYAIVINEQGFEAVV